jgi:long-chain acyl-CoA synthetase
MDTVYALFAAAAHAHPGKTAVEFVRRHDSLTHSYADLFDTCERAAALLVRLGVRPGDRCAILADNDARWCAAYLGCLRLGATAVPLDTAYRPDQVRTVVADCGAAALWTSAKYLETARAAVSGLEAPPRLVLVAGTTPGTESMDEAPAAPLSTPCPAGPDDTAVILYTSGTTSDPKGVMLSHGNLVAERAAAFKIVSITDADSILGVLPLFHALAQVANLLVPLTVGARIVFMETVNGTEMVRVLATGGISAFCVVPQFYYLIHQRVMERVASASWPARVVFRSLLRANGFSRRWFRVNLGRLFFGRVHAAVGRGMRILVTGGSRFDPKVGHDLFDMGLNIIQAYGLTECSGAGTATRPGDPHIESVGQPLDGVEVRIVAEPGEARREHPDGEVLIRGPVVMKGYFNRADATAEALVDGWLRTGDLGYLDAHGRLYITGRKKEIIVLASGKNIYPEEIEAVYAESPFIKELCVLGVSRPDEPAAERLHAIVVPDQDVMRERRVVNMREVIRFDVEGLSLRLPHHKRVLSFDVWLDDLPRTTTRKLKRHAIEERYLAGASGVAGDDASAPDDDDPAWMSDPHVAHVLDVIRGALKPGAPLHAGASLELDLGLDSMERVELLTALEHACGIEVPEDTAQGLYTVRELVEALRPAEGAAAARDASRVDPWTRLLSEPPDPDLGYLMEPRPFYTPVAFVVVRAWALAARALFGLRSSGQSHLSRTEPYLISPNHQSYLDAFVLVASVPYRVFGRLFFVGASEYFATPLSRWFARLIHLVPVDPDANLVRAMQAGAFGLRNGRVLVLFPEGERSPDGTPRAFKKGAAILSTHLGVPIVPVAIRGVFELWPRGRGFQWKALWPVSSASARVLFGEPLSPAPAEPGTDTAEEYSRLTARLRDAVTALYGAPRPPLSH